MAEPYKSKYGGVPVDDQEFKSKYGGVPVGDPSTASTPNAPPKSEESSQNLVSSGMASLGKAGQYVKETLGNVPESLARQVVNIPAAVASLAISGGFTGGVPLQVSPIDPDYFGTGYKDPGLAGYYTNGFADNFKKDPVRAIADASALLGIGTAGLRAVSAGTRALKFTDAANTLTRAANTTSYASDILNPLTAVNKVLGAYPNAAAETGEIAKKVVAPWVKSTGNALAAKAPPSMQGFVGRTADATSTALDALGTAYKWPREVAKKMLFKSWGIDTEELTPYTKARMQNVIVPGETELKDASGRLHTRPILDEGRPYGEPNVEYIGKQSQTTLQNEVNAAGEARQVAYNDPRYAGLTTLPQDVEDHIKYLRSANAGEKADMPKLEAIVGDTVDNLLNPNIAPSGAPPVRYASTGRYNEKLGDYAGVGDIKKGSPLSVGETMAVRRGPNGEKVYPITTSLDRNAKALYEASKTSGAFADVANRFKSTVAASISSLFKDSAEMLMNKVDPQAAVGTLMRNYGIGQSDAIDVLNVQKMNLSQKASTLVKAGSGYENLTNARVIGATAEGKPPAMQYLYVFTKNILLNRKLTTKILANTLSTVPVDSSKLRWVNMIGHSIANYQSQTPEDNPNAPPPNKATE